jgi:phosphoglucomutase
MNASGKPFPEGVAMLYHPATGFAIGDPYTKLFTEKRPSPADIRAAAKGLILSASGWRKVFAADGNENSLQEAVSPADLGLQALAAACFSEYYLEKLGAAAKETPLALGIDSRPTGPALADVSARVFLAKGIQLRYVFIAPAPEIFAYARQCGGFCYISASHNPPGHNGIKFGLSDGSVLSKEEADSLIARFRSLLADDARVEAALDAADAAPPKELALAYSSATQWKRQSFSAYLLLAREVVSAQADLERQEAHFERLSEALEAHPLGVLAEMNGSARSLSIDEDFLKGIGLTTRFVNDRPRQFKHRIVPEGESLTLCAEELQRLQAEDGNFRFGYVPDCDGDRGNLVYFDRDVNRPRILEAQEVFALSVLSELSFLEYSGHEGPVAVVANDPTSFRVDEIAKAFGAEVFRAEVGEANVVNLAREKRAAGYTVRILGEGSNGGSIVHPEAVRDPIATVFALTRLLALRGQGQKPGLFQLWLTHSGRGESYDPEFDLEDLIDSLPRYATSSAFEPRAALKIQTPPSGQAQLKAHYQRAFEASFTQRSAELKERYGIISWSASGYHGTVETLNLKDFALSGSCGL